MSGKDPEKTLLLVDGSSYLYRAFHALPGLKSPKTGEPTGAIYGVLNMLRKLAADYKPAALACVFDAKGKTFRDAEYAAYKANRAPMPDELGAQVAPLLEAVAALGWPVLVIDGVEADDVIATLAEQAKRKGWRTVISTGDKDLTQLVDERVLWINTMSNEKLDPAGVQAKFGVPPDKIVDYLSLVGDAIDNIPGVEGVGPSFAAKWIKQYGSLDDLISNAQQITGTRGENLRKALDWLPKARQLLTVKRDVPLSVQIEDLTLKPDPERQRAQYERFGFKSWLREVEGPAAPAPVPAAPAPVAQRKYARCSRKTNSKTWCGRSRSWTWSRSTPSATATSR
jgi:DNA polymerase-1